MPKDSCWAENFDGRFGRLARAAQGSFAAEIRCVGRGYYVQVPYRWFVFETHNWLPFFYHLPRELQAPLMRVSSRFWIKASISDYYLPSIRDIKIYFPQSHLEFERFAGMIKSLFAIRSKKRDESQPETD